MAVPTSSNKPTSDMSVKVGGRVFHPALPVVDGAFPTETEQGFWNSLAAYVSTNIPLESREGIQTRERVLDQMGALCRDWIRSVCASKGLAPDVIEMAGGALYTSGSYRLGTVRSVRSIQQIQSCRTQINHSFVFSRPHLSLTIEYSTRSLSLVQVLMSLERILIQF
jgi:hypothetical protein